MSGPTSAPQPADLSTGVAPSAGEERAVRSSRGRSPIVLWLCIGWMALITALAIGADLLPLSPPNRTGVGGLGEGPSLHHLLGTDELGRDVFTRIVFGARVTLVVGFSSIALGLAVGGTIGLIAGFRRGMAESALMRGMDIMLAFPPLVFALAVTSSLGHSILDVTLVLGILAVAPLARVVRSSALAHSGREYILAARVLGATGRRIVVREILPNVMPAAVSFAVIGVATAMVAEGGLSFLGLGVDPAHPTWGGMISQGYAVLDRYPLASIIPAVALFVTVLALNLTGEELRARFDVKETAL